MANIKLRRYDGSSWDTLNPETTWSQIQSKPSTFTATSHTHGNITNGGEINATATIASGDHLVIADNSSGNDLTTSSITFGTSTTQFLRNNGTWGTVSGSDSTKLPLAGGTMTGDLTLDHDGESTANDSHGVVLTARFNSTDFTRKLYMDDGANLLFGANTIFHSGNDGSSSGLHADLLDGQQGSYYLNYNNFTNTPTIPTNNNQLTNGAGYITADSTKLPLTGGTLTGQLIIDNSTTNRIRLYTEAQTSKIADTFSDSTTDKSYIYFDAGTTSNDPGYIMHETSNSETNEGVLHIVPSDDNSYGDYVSIHGTNDPDKLKLHTDGTIEGVNNLTLSGNITVGGTVDGVDIAALNTTVSNKANTASPALTGTPTAPTAAANTNTTQIATTAYVQGEITDLIGGAPGALDTLNELAAAINDDSSYASTITTALAGKMSTSHPANNHTSTHLYMSNGDGFIWNDTSNVMSVRKDGTDYTNWDSGNLTNLNQLTNGPGYVTTDTNTTYSAGTGLALSGTTFNLDFSELTDITLDVTGTSEMIVQVGSTEGRKALGEIDISVFNNDSGFTSNTGDITNVSTGGGLTGGGSSGSVTISHADTSSQASVNNSGRTYIQDITLDTYGHITGITSATETVTNTNTQLSNEQVQDIVGAMVSSNSESGISVTYQDTDGTLDFNVNDPTITLTGDVTGSATMTNLGNVSITATVADDSHNHTIANIDNLQTSLNGKLSTTAAAAAISYTTSCPTSNNSTGMKVYVGSTDCSTKYSGWLYLIT